MLLVMILKRKKMKENGSKLYYVHSSFTITASQLGSYVEKEDIEVIE